MHFEHLLEFLYVNVQLDTGNLRFLDGLIVAAAGNGWGVRLYVELCCFFHHPLVPLSENIVVICSECLG